MNGENVSEKLRAFIERYRRPAFRPIVREGHATAGGSQFNGSPLLCNGESWPECALCAKPMAMFLQLNLATLPPPYSDQFGSGILQLFYCARAEDHDYTKTEEWEAFDHKTKLARVIAADAAAAVALPRDVSLAAKPLAIVGWERFEEAPNTEAAEELGLKTERERSDPRNVRTKFVCEALGLDTGWLSDEELDQVYERDMAPAFKDKLGGWPGWVQGVEYPSCTICGVRMKLVFQIDSEDHVPWMFGDMGCGHITQCPEHKEVVTFAWACH